MQINDTEAALVRAPRTAQVGIYTGGSALPDCQQKERKERQMARRKPSGFLETLLKSAFGVGTTVHYRTDWLGRRQKVVKHHDTGKTKTYTHSDGFLFGGTTTRTTHGGRTIERGRIRKGFFGGVTEHAKRDDGTTVERRYRSGLFTDYVTTTEDGDCYGCGGSGQKTLNCRNCDGIGLVDLPAKTCFRCEGRGKSGTNACGRCNGSGVFQAERTVNYRRCEGAGEITVACKRCAGSGKREIHAAQVTGAPFWLSRAIRVPPPRDSSA